VRQLRQLNDANVEVRAEFARLRTIENIIGSERDSQDVSALAPPEVCTASHPRKAAHRGACALG